MSKQADITQGDNFFRGEHRELWFDIVDAAGAPLNVSSFALKWALESQASATGIIEKTGAPGLTVTNGAGTGDRVKVLIDAADTQPFVQGIYGHALWRKDAGSESVLSYGSAVLQRASAEPD